VPGVWAHGVAQVLPWELPGALEAAVRAVVREAAARLAVARLAGVLAVVAPLAVAREVVAREVVAQGLGVARGEVEVREDALPGAWAASLRPVPSDHPLH